MNALRNHLLPATVLCLLSAGCGGASTLEATVDPCEGRPKAKTLQLSVAERAAPGEALALSLTGLSADERADASPRALFGPIGQGWTHYLPIGGAARVDPPVKFPTNSGTADQLVVSASDTSMRVRLPEPLKPGDYRICWQATLLEGSPPVSHTFVSADLHIDSR